MPSRIWPAQASSSAVLNTVTGQMAGSNVVKALAHEHFYGDFFGPTEADYMNVNWSDVYRACILRAVELKSQDVNLGIDWTNIGIGRNVELLRNIALESGIDVVFATGIYKGLIPPAMEDMSMEQISEVFIEELTQGVEHTPSRAGFIKAAATEDESTETETMVHHAAAIAANETGSTIGFHCPQHETLWNVVNTLKSENFNFERLVWAHAQVSPTDEHKKAADLGITVQFDAVSTAYDPFFNGPTDDGSMLDRIEALASNGYEDQVMLSADSCVFVNPPEWQSDRDSLYIHRTFASKLAERTSEDLVKKVLRNNVVHAFRKGDHV